MKADVAFGDEARLDDEEDDPGREYGSVQVDQEAGWIREDGTLEEVAGGEADDDDREHDDGEGGEEDVVDAALYCACNWDDEGGHRCGRPLLGWL